MFDGVRYILKIYEKYDDVPTSLTLVSLGIKLRQKQYDWICPYISRHLLSLNPSLAHCRRYSRGER